MLIAHERMAPDIAASVPDVPADTPPAAADRPRVWLLGPAPVDGLGVTRRSHSIELIAHLAPHPAGASGDTLMERLWPGQPPDNNRLNRVVVNANATGRCMPR